MCLKLHRCESKNHEIINIVIIVCCFLQVNRLRRVGNDQLMRSDCYQAAHYFNVSRQVLAKLEASQKIGNFGDS